jgi:YbbR domain-containing protein
MGQPAALAGPPQQGCLMGNPLRVFFKYLPSLLLAFALAVAVWISAVTAADPNEERVFPRQIAVEILGQGTDLVLTTENIAGITLTLSAPRSIWDRLTTEQVTVRAVVDLAGLGAGTHTVPVQVQVGIRPVQIIASAPRTLRLTLEKLTSKVVPVHILSRGDLAVGFQADAALPGLREITVTGPESAVNRVSEAQAVLDISQAQETISRILPLQVVDANQQGISGVTLSPDRVTVSQAISQRGGFRNVVVKVIPTGIIATGYRLTNITVSPPAVTVSSTDPKLVNDLPGFIETQPLNLNGVKEDFDMRLALNLPKGVSVVGETSVLVQVGVATIEGSITISFNRVEVANLAEGLAGKVSPETVDIILSGPLPILDTLRPENIRVFVDMKDTKSGTYQRTPKVELTTGEVRVDSILPGTVEVTVSPASTVTPTPRR